MSKSDKRRVTYTDLGRCIEGQSAHVYIRGQGWFRTTKVIEITPHCDGPVFETQNSIYWPAPTDGTSIDVAYKYMPPARGAKENDLVPQREPQLL